MSASAPLRPIETLRLDLDVLEEGVHLLDVALPLDWQREVVREIDATPQAEGAARLEVTIHADQTILVRGRLELGYDVPCARCLAPARVDVGAETGDLCLTFVPRDRLRAWAELPGLDISGDEAEGIDPLEAAELDELPHDGHVLDLRPALAEQIVVVYPMRALCSAGEQCRGLCQRCGAELNSLPPDAVRCLACGAPFDGSDADSDPDSPWKRALAKLGSDPGTNEA
jgi:uncharacterized metal-binding protein YceD (DUF177 family)